MQIYLVTPKSYEFYKCAYYKGINCYILGFGRYRNCRAEGEIFSSARKALEYMLVLEGLRRYK